MSLTVLKEGTAHPLLCAKAQAIGFCRLNYVCVWLWWVVVLTRTVRDMDVENETTGMCLCRVLVSTTTQRSHTPVKSA